jgi:subfamily B ATP-binding cassette protein MsbA
MRNIIRALAFLKGRQGKVAALLVASLAFGGCSFFFVIIVKEVMDAALELKNRHLLWHVGGLFVTVALGRTYFAYARTVLSKYLSYRIARDAQNTIMGHLLTMPISYFHGQRSGELIARMTTDVNALRRSINLATEFVKSPIELAWLIGAAFSIDWRLSLIGFVGFPLAIGPLVILSRKMRKASRKTRQKMADLASSMVQIFGGIRLVRAYGQEKTEVDRFVRTNESRFRQSMRKARAKALSRGTVELLSAMGLAGAFIVGGMMIIGRDITVGDVSALLIALIAMYRPAKALAKANEDIQDAIPGAERIFELHDVRSDLPEAPNAVEVTGLRDGIEVRNVSFSYVADTPVLRDVSLRVEKGQTVALVGPTGAGKSTLLDLVCRFYDPTEGAITIDGMDLREVKIASLLAQIAIVPQEPFLFNDTVRANILYGRPGASDEEVRAAAGAAAIGEEILQLSDGYDTVVGERGTRLSGGQRQRVSIARALLRNAPILVLDEATSSLDSESERLVQAAVERLLEGRTTLVIAHRLSTIRGADRIAVLVDGRIEETGSHEELLESSDTYRRLWQMQQSGRVPAPPPISIPDPDPDLDEDSDDL